jgi:hypothetical protein
MASSPGRRRKAAPGPITRIFEMPEDDLVSLQVCADHIAAEVLANRLRTESIPATVRNLGPVPGLEQGSVVLVPAALQQRARWLLSHELPTDAELNYLATGTLGHSDATPESES